MSWAISLQAQQFNVNLSPSGKGENNVTDFHRYGDYLYSNKTNWGKMQLAFTANLKKVKYGVELTQYDKDLKELKKLSLDNGEKDFGPFRPLVHYGADAIYVMYFKFVDDDKVKMYVSKVNPEDLSVMDTKEVMEYDQKNKAFWGAITTIDATQTFYTVSEDEKKAWIVHASPTLLISTVIDGDLNLIQKTESVPVKLRELFITGAHIGNDGNKVLVYRYVNPANKEFYGRGLFFQPANTKGSFKDVKFPNGSFPGNLELQQSKDGKILYLGGEYFGTDYKFAGQGVSLSEVNIALKSISTPVFYPYTDELRQRVFDLDFASRKKGQIVFSDYDLKYQINEMENGTIVMSADMEIYRVTSSHVNYSFKGPIIHAFIKPGGNVTMTLIPKIQDGGPYTEFFNYMFKDKLICIYADIPKYQAKEFSDKQISQVRTVDDLVPVANVYNSDGKLLFRKMLIDSKKEMKGNVMIGNVSSNGEDKFLLPIGESKANAIQYYTRVDQLCYLEIL
jgi:hypothetical protein